MRVVGKSEDEFAQKTASILLCKESLVSVSLSCLLLEENEILCCGSSLLEQFMSIHYTKRNSVCKVLSCLLYK